MLFFMYSIFNMSLLSYCLNFSVYLVDCSMTEVFTIVFPVPRMVVWT